MAIICSGSLAFDRLATYPGLFADLIIPDKLPLINICFMVNHVERVHGGTAGNIAYNLHLLGEKPLIVTTLGDDPDGHDYLARLRDWGLSTETIGLTQAEATAGAYIATDSSNNQLIFFNPGAMNTPSDFDPASLPGPKEGHLAIVSPGGLSDMKKLGRLYREQGVKFIFDPGQQIPVFTGPELLDMLDGSLMLMTNEYELDLFLKSTGLKAEELFQYTQAVLTTLGENGSRLSTPRGSQHILPVPVERTVNPTGAGDAYRAGVLKGLSGGEEILTSCRLGATIAAFCVEAPGTQGHTFTPGHVLARHYRTFKENLSCLG